MTNQPTTTEAALEPCPLAHPVKEGLNLWGSSAGRKWHIWCHDCGLQFDGRLYQPKDEVIKTWNSRIPAPSVAPEVDDPANMTDAELRAATTFHQAQAARYSNEAAKVWRLRLRMGHPTPGDEQRLVELNERRAAAPASPVAPQQSLSRDPVCVNVTPPVVVTRNGVPCEDQQAALEEFKEACRFAATAITQEERQLTPNESARLEQDNDMARDRAPDRTRHVGSSRHPHFTHADHERMKETLDALSDYPTEEEAEAVLQACGTSGKEVVNEFIERLLKENLELTTKLESATPPYTLAQAAADLFPKSTYKDKRQLTNEERFKFNAALNDYLFNNCDHEHGSYPNHLACRWCVLEIIAAIIERCFSGGGEDQKSTPTGLGSPR